MSAARRSEKRRVRSFVRLLDYMICGALNTLLTLSMNDMVAALTPLVAVPPPGLPGSETSALSAALPAKPVVPELDDLGLPRLLLSDSDSETKAQWGQPLLQISVEMDEETDELVFSPYAADFIAHVTQVGGTTWAGCS